MLPWTSLEANPQGTARPCCLYDEEITDPTGKKYKVSETTLTEIYKSDYMQKLRQDFRAGEKPSACFRCWDEEAAGMTSKRIHSRIRLKELYAEVDWENDTPDQLWFLDLKLGNICNLRCRICGSWSSSKWAQEEIGYMPELKDKKSHLAYTYLQQGMWPRNSPDFWTNLKTLLPEIKYFESESTLVPIFLTATETCCDISLTFKVHTALSATADVFAEPVTVIEFPALADSPLPTRLNPYPTPTARINAAIIVVIERRDNFFSWNSLLMPKY
jgi:hypothetical protein